MATQERSDDESNERCFTVDYLQCSTPASTLYCALLYTDLVREDGLYRQCWPRLSETARTDNLSQLLCAGKGKG